MTTETLIKLRPEESQKLARDEYLRSWTNVDRLICLLAEDVKDLEHLAQVRGNNAPGLTQKRVCELANELDAQYETVRRSWGYDT